MLSKADAIGIFDSGVGGLTVLREVRRRLPAENLIYLGDTARVPYGTKSKEIVQLYSLQNTAFLQKRGVKAIVVACNSASSCALPLLARTFPKLPITGVILPGAEAAARATRTGRIGVIGTHVTIRSGAYRRALKRLLPHASVFDHAAPLLVPLAEEGLTTGDVARHVIRHYLAPLRRKKIDTLILGCTHYPLLKRAMHAVLGPEVRLVDSAVEAAGAIAARLEEMDLLRAVGRGARVTFCVTDTADKFHALARRFVGEIHGPVTRVRVD